MSALRCASCVQLRNGLFDKHLRRVALRAGERSSLLVARRSHEERARRARCRNPFSWQPPGKPRCRGRLSRNDARHLRSLRPGELELDQRQASRRPVLQVARRQRTRRQSVSRVRRQACYLGLRRLLEPLACTAARGLRSRRLGAGSRQPSLRSVQPRQPAPPEPTHGLRCCVRSLGDSQAYAHGDRECSLDDVAGVTNLVIATHSPILLSCPQARIYSFDQTPVAEIASRSLPSTFARLPRENDDENDK